MLRKCIGIILHGLANHVWTIAATGTGILSSKVTIEHFTKLRELFIPTIFKFNLDFYVPKSFGTPGALIVNNGHRSLVLDWLKLSVTSEFLLQAASVTMPDKTVITFTCNSWVYPTEKNSLGRVFFSNKVRNYRVHSSCIKYGSNLSSCLVEFFIA